jgi:hypothetical protein
MKHKLKNHITILKQMRDLAMLPVLVILVLCLIVSGHYRGK